MANGPRTEMISYLPEAAQNSLMSTLPDAVSEMIQDEMKKVLQKRAAGEVKGMSAKLDVLEVELTSALEASSDSSLTTTQREAALQASKRIECDIKELEVVAIPFAIYSTLTLTADLSAANTSYTPRSRHWRGASRR